MKIITILGTRPEIIRLSCIIPLLDKFLNHVLVNTNQNYDPNLNKIFFTNFDLREPDYTLDTQSLSTMEQIGKIFHETEKILKREKPDKILVLGDTNSALTAFVAKRLGIPVYHMEAGNRCYDNRVPEEVNRKVIDHCTTIHMPYTERSRSNLIKEGIDNRFIYVIGNPIKEVIQKFANMVHNEYSNLKPYILVTLHRAENVDHIDRLDIFLQSLKLILKKYNYNIIISTHPRTRNMLNKHFSDYLNIKGMYFIDPVDFKNFVCIQKEAVCVLTDSGTVQEECCILNIPNITLRDTTERPETIEAGSNIIAGCNKESILENMEIVLNSSISKNFTPIPEYEKNNVSETVLKILSSI